MNFAHKFIITLIWIWSSSSILYCYSICLCCIFMNFIFSIFIISFNSYHIYVFFSFISLMKLLWMGFLTTKPISIDVDLTFILVKLTFYLSFFSQLKINYTEIKDLSYIGKNGHKLIIIIYYLTKIYLIPNNTLQ